MNLDTALRHHVFAENAADMLDRYLNREAYSGAWFDVIGGSGDAPDVANRFTPADIIAVSTLSVNIPGWAAIELLDRRADQLEDLLANVPNDLELAEASDDVIEAVFAVQVPSTRSLAWGM